MKFNKKEVEQGSDLELAPMVDVVFLLLIFFIVTWKYARFEKDIGITLPESKKVTETEKRDASEIILNVKKNGEVVINGFKKTNKELLDLLKNIYESFPDQAVVLRGDKETKYQKIVDIINIVKKSGINNFHIATLEK